jgi:SAM-dependent methyltransferase
MQQTKDLPDRPRPAREVDMPPCPLTGKPALRRVHGVSTKTIEGIWRHAQGIDVSHLFAGHDRLTLYESPTGLYFFEPRIVGDGCFYDEYYRRWHFHEALTRYAESRVDYIRAAGYIPAGAEVIDVGCGPGVFRQHLAHAHYTGLDPYAGPDADAAIVRETLEAHAARRPGYYDAATAFHVIEHVADPRHHAELMVRLLKPGGLLILAAPLHASPLTEIPNLPLNIPPHHLTWWNPQAFRALAGELGLAVVEAVALPPSPHQGMVFWLHRLLFKRTDPAPCERYVAHRWSWHASVALAYQLARVAHRIKTMPAGVRPIDAFLVARKDA